MTLCRAILGFVLTAALAAAPALARADAANGARLAQLWCSSCHVTGNGTPQMVQPGPPSFRSVARRLTGEQIRTFLTKPHGAMPDLSLTRSEIDDLAAYIQSLR